MWNIKYFKTREAMNRFTAKHGYKLQWNEIFINNGYAIEYRKLRIIDIK